VALRGVALDLPLDVTKVSLDSTTLALNTAVFTDAAPAAKAALGNGPLKETLVFGAAKKGTGTTPAGDSTLNLDAEVASFVLKLVPEGGKGVVFDGSTLTANPAFKARLQNASGATMGAIAVGKLEVL
jgi:hypothetical protein